MLEIKSFRNRFIQVLIVLVFFLCVLIIARTHSTVDINKKSEIATSFEVAPDIMYFVIYTPEREYIISGIEDISEIINTLKFVGYSYEYSGDFDYELILGCVNLSGIVESNLLIKDNYLVNGDRIFDIGFNIENYLKNIAKRYN